MAENEEKAAKPDDKAKGKGEKDKKDTKPPNPKKKAIIIGAIILVLLIIQGGTAFFIVSMFKGEDMAQVTMENNKKKELEQKKMLTRIGAVLEEPITLTVNIAGSQGSHYLKSVIQFDWDEEAHPELRSRIAERLAKIRNIIIDVLSTQSYEELLLKTGRQRAKEAIKAEVNKILPENDGQIYSVFFQEYLIQ
ncbi:MAG: flagellar basal body-associated FliL family protein [Fibrobacteria bacterium]|nr:flagellar basal body-associated FliL family protein [Fibrobacteria bacterium]